MAGCVESVSVTPSWVPSDIKYRRLINAIIVLCFILHLGLVVVGEPTNAHRRCGWRRDIEGLSWLVTYALSLVLYIIGYYHQYLPTVSMSYLLCILALAILLLLWDVLFYFQQRYFWSYVLYTLLAMGWTLILIHALSHYPYLALIQLPVYLRLLGLYVGDNDHCHF